MRNKTKTEASFRLTFAPFFLVFLPLSSPSSPWHEERELQPILLLHLVPWPWCIWLLFFSWLFFSLFSLMAAAHLFYPLLNVFSHRHPRGQLGPAWCSLPSPWPPLRTGCGLGESNCTETHNMILNIGPAVTQNWSSSSCLVLLKYLWNCLLAYW